MIEEYFGFIKEGNLSAIKSLKSTGQIYGSEIDVDGYCAMHEAAKHGRVEIMEWLLIEANLTVNEQSEGGNTPLHVAAKNGQIISISWLIENKADQDLTNNMGQTYLDILCEEYPVIYQQFQEAV